MKPSSVIMIICICLILSGIPGTVAIDSPQYDKSVNIYLKIDNGQITAKSTEILYGTAPNPFPTQEGFKGELVAADGSIVKTFTVWDPRVQFGDVIVSDANIPRIHGVVDRQNPVDSVVIFPFDPKVTEFRLYNSAEGTLLTSVDLKPHIDSFFASYPNDPDNPALYGSKAPLTVNPIQTMTMDPVVKLSGQVWGILVIGTGAVLILIGAFASVWFLRMKPKSILIVDDNQDIIAVIDGMLKLNGYVTRTATSGEECLKELESAVPDLILLDIGMEPMDGWETLKRIKKNPTFKGIPVMMLTALRLTPKDVENYGIFIEDYVMKPVTEENLKNAIIHIFARREMIKEQIAVATGAGADRDKVCECARLTRIVDVNKRLHDLLIKTYDLEAGVMQGAENEMVLAIKNLEGTFRNQENRLEQIQRSLGSSLMI